MKNSFKKYGANINDFFNIIYANFHIGPNEDLSSDALYVRVDKSLLYGANRHGFESCPLQLDFAYR